MSGWPSARGTAAVLLYRVLTYLPSLPLGAIAYAWWRRASRVLPSGQDRRA